METTSSNYSLTGDSLRHDEAGNPPKHIGKRSDFCRADILLRHDVNCDSRTRETLSFSRHRCYPHVAEIFQSQLTEIDADEQMIGRARTNHAKWSDSRHRCQNKSCSTLPVSRGKGTLRLRCVWSPFTYYAESCSPGNGETSHTVVGCTTVFERL